MIKQKKNDTGIISSPLPVGGGGIIFLHKKPGVTSFQALGRIKKVLNTGKVGHTGTLDKFAEGLLILLTGKLTRMNALITDLDKEYEALIRFGRETDTLDPEGETVAEADPPSLEAIESVIHQFKGEISQTPPRYSAIHIDGRRAHELARSGKEVEMPSREITIHDIEILGYENNDLKLRVHCSKGTYIRSLARDIGTACNSRAYVQELVRTAVGPFSLDTAVDVENFRGPADFYSWEEFFLKLGNSRILTLNELGLKRMKDGIPFRKEFLSVPAQDSIVLKNDETEYLLLKDSEGILKAVLEYRDGRYQYKINLCS
ncbi:MULTISPECIES: tRNA pseudouridine(55) synthase TruB [unclassified Oceanispirochaeta]|uniref:tRNA pseudouridine(55) synthase TruB n=1 Tax=unclassified Oceanispirochaeta TaxID=2635722 RepID=UPI000E094B49|nr:MULTISPECIES: tRNA pseudouridine(55) synthase TruB [unclassified Oceanispirochaeta]MBF9017243.1 tRNA pseudouridine(55) synthase TruB [Oceanispirochaeta sp. M2]NPD73692.1 tRNA pseudouridine(55) synthase TruB [Oceanispirochaeta sp. M1]RDG30620.1 tRNA pseudouridine(55) synthase TruB [Oceanispirochaeta sp. M1]